MYDMHLQLLLASILTAYLLLRCYFVCRKQREPTQLYRRLREADDYGPVEDIVIPEAASHRLEMPETPPPSWWNFDNMRPLRASGSFMGPAVHAAPRAPVQSPRGPPPPYCRAANDAPTNEEPPPTYQQVINQRQESADISLDT